MGRGAARRAHKQSTGAATAARQKALATGPVSDRRTRMGAQAIPQAPAHRHRKARVSTLDGTARAHGRMIVARADAQPFTRYNAAAQLPDQATRLLDASRKARMSYGT